MKWDLRVTVAAIVEQNGRFLLVEELQQGLQVLNQPAGHLDPGESLLQAVIREVREETTCDFEPEAVIGIYLWPVPDSDRSYLRVAFSGRVGTPDPTRKLDDGILGTRWLSRHELEAQRAQWRSPLVGRCIDDYQDGKRYPLDVLISLLEHD